MSANRISQRIAAIAESATLKVDAKAKALKAEGKDVISFAAGEPDFATPQHIVEAAVLAVRDPKNHRYTPAAGLPELREAIVEKTKRDSGTDVTAAQVIVTNGGKQAVYQAFAVILDPQDEVLVPAPYWTTYPEAIKLAGGKQVDVFAGSDQDYKVTVAQLEAAYTPKTKALLLCSPSNPTGAVYTKEEILAIGQWVASKPNLWVVSDEIYQNLTYDGLYAHSITELVPELADRTIMVNGVAKTYAMTGWRLGYIGAPKEIAAACDKVQGQFTSATCSITQRAAIAAMKADPSVLKDMIAAFKSRRELVLKGLAEIPGLIANQPGGAFYVFPDCSSFFGKKYGDKVIHNSDELCLYLLEEGLVALVGGESFGAPNCFRISYAASEETLTKALSRMKEAFAKLS